MINILNFKKFLFRIIYFGNNMLSLPNYYYNQYFNKLAMQQSKSLDEIPVIVINYNQLFYLKKNIEQLIKYNFKKIVIIDNNSTYPELLAYYKTIENKVHIIKLDENVGHLVLYKKKEIFNKYCQGYYFLTDADIILSDHLPQNFREILMETLKKNHLFYTKVGFSLDLSDIPDSYPLKDKVLKWEKQFWTKELKKDFFSADIDTTFALYKPSYMLSKFSNFNKAIRIAGDFCAKHGGWYIDPAKFSKEQEFYFKDNISTSWIFDKKGQIESKDTNQLYE